MKLKEISEEFDQIRFPGGTSKEGDHFCCAITYKYVPETKKVMFLVVPYNSEAHKTQRNHVVDTSKNENESPEETLIRESFEETGLVPKIFKEMHYIRKTGPNRSKPGELHTKMYFLVEEAEGKLLEFSGHNPIDPETAAPIWMEYKELYARLFPGHIKALDAAVKILRMDKHCCMAFGY